MPQKLRNANFMPISSSSATCKAEGNPLGVVQEQASPPRTKPRQLIELFFTKIPNLRLWNAIMPKATGLQTHQSSIHRLVIEAKQQAYYYPEELVENIDNYAITSQKALMEIAVIVAQEDSETLIYHLDSFGIDYTTPKGQECLKNLALIAAEQEPQLLAENFRLFERLSREDCLEVTKKVAWYDGEAVTFFLDNFIADPQPKELVEIAKLAAIRGGEVVAEHIIKYVPCLHSDEGQQALREIAWVAAQNDPQGIVFYLMHFRIDPSQDEGYRLLLEILKLASKAYPLGVSSQLHKFTNLGVEVVHSIFQQAFKSAQHHQKTTLLEDLNTFYYANYSEQNIKFDCLNLSPMAKSIVDQQRASIGEIKDDFRRAGLEKWSYNFAFRLSVYRSDDKALSRLSEKGFFDILRSCRQPDLREDLTELLLRGACKPEFILNVDRYCKNSRRPERLLPAMLLSSLEIEGVEGCQDFWEQVVIPAKHDFKNKNNSLILISALKALAVTTVLSSHEKSSLIQLVLEEREGQVHDKSQILKTLKALIALMHSGEVKGLLNHPQKGLESYVLEMLNAKFQPTIPDFKDKFNDTFGNFRDRTALMIFHANLKHGDRQALNDLNLFVNSVAGGYFHDLRYDKSKSSHLALIFEGRPQLEAEWRKGACYDYQKWQVVDTDDPQDLLMSTTEVGNSCQSVHNAPRSSQFLLGYLLNGQNRMIAAKDSSGRIVARHFLRLLWDNKTKQPLLFLEKEYNVGHVQQGLREELLKMARQRSQDLKIPLISNAIPGEKYQGDIQSLPGLTVYHHSDAALTREYHKGTFKLQVGNLIHRPFL
ncbi:MAG: hypothetical protein ACQEP8_00700 [Chlamydiota bacterium]